MNIEKSKQVAWEIGIVAGAALVLLLLVLVIAQGKEILGLGNHAPVNTITVSGTADVTVIPNIATFSFGVTETAKTVAAAQDAATAKTDAAINALVDSGVAESDVQTLSYAINPHYDYQSYACTLSGVCPPSKSVLTGYDVSQSIQVKVHDLSKAGELFQKVGTLGVENVNNLQFSVDNLDNVKDQARARAIAAAHKNARKLSDELGVDLIRTVSFSDNADSGTPYPVMYQNAVGASAKAAPTIPAGNQKVSDTVQIVYEIK